MFSLPYLVNMRCETIQLGILGTNEPQKIITICLDLSVPVFRHILAGWQRIDTVSSNK